MESWQSIVVVAYVTLLAVLSIYGLHRYSLLYLYLRHYKYGPRRAPPAPERYPSVTVQLPLYNERYVARRVIEAAARLRYPRELLRVQVLDDSVDDTCQIARDTAGTDPASRPVRCRRGSTPLPTNWSPSSTPTSCRRPTSSKRRCRIFKTPAWAWCRRAGAISIATTRS
jgi:cellulose synthase/poly-beta-1,6-N-acetylglucosamine synthase-like glycosyltransferase